jgi:hypothetical protein
VCVEYQDREYAHHTTPSRCSTSALLAFAVPITAFDSVALFIDAVKYETVYLKPDADTAFIKLDTYVQMLLNFALTFLLLLSTSFA